MNEPVFRIPASIVGTAALFVALHALIGMLDAENYTQIILLFSFIPARYDSEILWPGGLGSQIWTFFSYSFLHADWMHVALNSLWLVVFGAPVARRFGTTRVMLLALICAFSGAVFHLVTNLGSATPMMGASAIVSGLMAASSRFIFAPGGSLDPYRQQRSLDDYSAFFVPATPLSRMLHSRQAIFFLGIWLLINFGFGVMSLLSTGENTIAWQAHLGGFLAGILLFDALDPCQKKPPRPKSNLRVVK